MKEDVNKIVFYTHGHIMNFYYIQPARFFIAASALSDWKLTKKIENWIDVSL